ncbi:MAG: hypothetical protein KDA91_20890, partial [Planctomycetaceae bacterium]|nr:hypothetical protein [Planctomycetaceae bacterium]
LSKPPFSGSRPLIGSLPSGLTGKPGGGSSTGTGLIKPGTLINPTTRPQFPGLGGIGNPGSGNPGSGNPGSGNPGGGNPGSGNPGSGNPGSGNPGGGNPGSSNPGSGNPGSGNPGSGNPGSGGGAGWGLGGWLHHHHNHCWKPWTGCYGGFHCTTTVQPIILPTTVIIDQPVEIVTQIPATMNPAAAIDLAVRGATLLKIEGEATSRTFQIAIENRGPSDLTVPVRVAIFAVHDGVTTGELPNVTQMLDALPAGTIGTLEMTLPTSAIGANQIVVAIETPEGLTDIDESNNMAQGEIALLPVAVMGSAN